MKPHPTPNAYPKPIGPAWQDKHGYWCIWIPGKKGKRGRKAYLHRLIYEQAHGPIPKSYVIHHIDEDKSNCSLSNLRCLSAGAHMSKHKRDTRPSHVVQRDGTVTKKCVLDGQYWPLRQMVRYRTPTGGLAYRPYCRTCYYWEYGFGKQLLEAQA